jgi:hypothetical protein
VTMFDVYLVPGDSLLVARPQGILDVRTAEEIIKFVEIKEVAIETGFNRFCDLTYLAKIRLSPAHVLPLAARRGAFNPNDIHVKAAFFATDILGLKIANMYKRLLNSPRIEVRVWSNIQEAADWLGVERKLLLL